MHRTGTQVELAAWLEEATDLFTPALLQAAWPPVLDAPADDRLHIVRRFVGLSHLTRARRLPAAL